MDYFSSGVSEAIEQLIEAGGSDETTRITIRPNRIGLDLATEPGATTFDDYDVWDGELAHNGPSTTQPSFPERDVFHLSDIAWERLPDLLEEALASAERATEDLSSDPYLIARRSPFFGDEYPVTLLVYLPGDYESPIVEFDADGALIRVR